jgi:hypothetical protein
MMARLKDRKMFVCQPLLQVLIFTTLFHLAYTNNDKPNVTTSNESPQEGDNVELTCVPDTTDAISSYEWHKGNEKIENANAAKYQLPGNTRANSGSYQCKVNTTVLSELSDALVVNFLCKLYVVIVLDPPALEGITDFFSFSRMMKLSH